MIGIDPLVDAHEA